MFERFSATARAVVGRAAESASRDAAPDLGPGRLLFALTTDDGAAGAALAEAGVTGPEVQRQLRAGAERTLDEEALAGLGIDVERVRRSVEEAFGPGALDAPTGRRRTHHRRVAGDAARFAPGSVYTLQLALRAAVSAGSREIRSEHLLLGLLDTADPQLTRLLAGCGTDAASVRARLDEQLRRSA